MKFTKEEIAKRVAEHIQICRAPHRVDDQGVTHCQEFGPLIPPAALR